MKRIGKFCDCVVRNSPSFPYLDEAISLSDLHAEGGVDGITTLLERVVSKLTSKQIKLGGKDALVAAAVCAA